MMRDLSSVLWRCRRGSREMDLLLQQFVAAHYENLSAEEKTAFKHLLEESDPDIMDWIAGRTEPPTTAFRHLIEKIRTAGFHPSSNTS